MELENNDDIHVAPSRAEIDLAANAVLGNPDTSKFGGPPDGVTGVASTTQVCLVEDFKLSDYPGAGSVWVVQWPTECPTGSNPVAYWLIGGSEDAASSIPGAFTPAVTAEPGWTGAGYATTLAVGGLCVYVMGKEVDGLPHSPFATKQLDVKGPMNPLATIRLQPGGDVAHDLFRLLGGSYEIIDTTADLYKQGRSISCCIDNPKLRPVQITVLQTPIPGAQSFGTYNTEVFTLPFGSTKDMTRVTNSVTMAMGLGVFAPNRITLTDNMPDSGFNVSHLYVGPYDATCQSAVTQNQHVCLALGSSWQLVQTAAAGPVYSAVRGVFNTSYTGKLWSTNTCMSMTVIGGVNTEQFSCQFQRKIVSQCFVNAASDKYFALATPTRVPTDYGVMAALSNAQRVSVDFFPSEFNRTGKAFRRFKKVLDTGLKLTKPVASIGKSMVKDMVNTAVASNPALAAAKAGLQTTAGRAITKAATQSAKRRAKKAVGKALQSSSK